MLPAWTPVIAAHAVAAVLCLALGGFQVARRVRGDTVHRTVGWVWAGLMLFLAAVSFGFGTWADPVAIFLRVLATWVLVSVTLGIVAARRGNIARHRGFMIGNYIGLAAALVGAAAVPSRRLPSWFAAHPVAMSLVTVGLVAVAGFVIAAAFAAARRVRVG